MKEGAVWCSGKNLFQHSVGVAEIIAELNQLATVLSLPDKNGDVLVRAGIIKTKVPLKGLKQPEKLVKEAKPQTKAQQRYSRLTGDANRPNGRVERVQRTAKMECNLLGLTVDEALPEVDSFIDRAILNGQWCISSTETAPAHCVPPSTSICEATGWSRASVWAVMARVKAASPSLS